jgi:nickel transport protein
MREKWYLTPWVAGALLALTICVFAAPVLAEEPTLAAPAAPVEKVAGLDQKALEASLNKVLNHQLAPVKEMLTELTIHQTSLTDILGGIGYIMGFFGLWAYFQSKKRQAS